MGSTGMSKNEIIKWLITFALTLIVVLIPTGDLYTEKMKLFVIITVFSLSVIAFEFLPNVVMVVLLPVLYIVCGVAPANVVMSPWLGETLLMVMGACILAAVLTDSGVLTRIAYFLMAKVNGSYLALLMAIYFAGVLVTFITFGNAYLIIGTLCAGLCMSLNQMQTKFGAGVGMAAILGTCTAKTYLYNVVAYSIVTGASNGLADATFAEMTLVSAIWHNCPMFFVTTLMVFMTAKICKPETNLDGRAYFISQLEALGKMTMVEKKAGVLAVLVLVYCLSCSFTGLNMNWGFMILPWLAFFPIVKCADADTLKYMNWDMLFFVSGCMAIGSVATTLGFGEILEQMLGVLFVSESPIFIFAALLGVVFVMNFLMTPMAIWALLSAPLLGVVAELGMNQLPFIYALVSCSEAILLPYEFAPYLLLSHLFSARGHDCLRVDPS